jgi:hypothetical protein
MTTPEPLRNHISTLQFISRMNSDYTPRTTELVLDGALINHVKHTSAKQAKQQESMILDNVTYYGESQLQRGPCACCGAWRNDIIIKEELCIECFERKNESIERLIKSLNL